MTALEKRGANVRATAKAFGIAERVLRTMITNGVLRSYKVGGCTVVLWEDVTAAIRQQPAPTAPRRRNRINNVMENPTCQP
jgi:hypothetical protein